MLAELTGSGSAWLLAISLALALAAQGILAGRRRTALNEALHELRRPLQALVLSVPGDGGRASVATDLPLQTQLALDDLDRRINGGPQSPGRAPAAVAGLLESAHRRWSGRARSAGASLDLKLDVGAATVALDRAGFSQALDNLIINAIEHGGPRIEVGAELFPGVLRVRVADSGRAREPHSRRLGVSHGIEIVTGRRRHGYGLRVVRRVAAAHGGDFRLCRGGEGAEAVLELPLAGGSGGG